MRDVTTGCTAVSGDLGLDCPTSKIKPASGLCNR
jgi:hypothetical protein